MSTSVETGHAKNVANFKKMIAFVAAYGAQYNPSSVELQLGSLNVKAAEAQQALTNLNTHFTNYGHAVSKRETAFAPLQKLSTKMLNALKASNASHAVIEHMQSQNRKMQGKRAGKKLPEPSANPNQPLAEQSATQVSVSQQGYDNRLDVLDKQIKILAGTPAYHPNESELSLAGLQDHYTALNDENTAVVNTIAGLSKARLNRNQVMYHPETGMVAIAMHTKNYVKSLFGASSANYKQIAGLSFKTAK